MGHAGAPGGARRPHECMVRVRSRQDGKAKGTGQAGIED